ncbi:MAG TPA: PAS domain-containing protein [Bryobacteraceae bacterium]|jgi:PAS domain S-box-containing protein|nr:PAS domain-containing protein [Bryobacteraceae bacterium]
MLTLATTLEANETLKRAPGGATPHDCISFALYPDGRVSTWNEPAERMLGYSREQALGRHFAWFFPVDEVQRGESERVLRLAGENGFHQWEGAWLRKDHSRFRMWVGMLAVRHPSGKLKCYTVITRHLGNEAS